MCSNIGTQAEPPEVKVDERQIRERGGGYPPYPVPPPPRRGNTLRALTLLLAVALLAGFVLYGLLQLKESFVSGNADPIQEQIDPSPQDRTVIIQKTEKFVPYPKTRAEVADRFGGKPRDWSETWFFRGWIYTGDTPIEIPYGRNVTVYSDNLTLYWQQ
jgi:hypothetical protein